MKVLFVDQTGQLGGGELNLLETLPGLGVDASAVLFEDGPLREALEMQGVAVRLLPVGGLSRLRRSDGVASGLHLGPSIWRAVRRLRHLQRDFDAVYANSQKAFVLAALASWPSGPPLIWHLHDILTAAHFSTALRRLVVVLANRRASIVVANSAATGKAFTASGGDQRKVHVVHNGIAEAPSRP